MKIVIAHRVAVLFLFLSLLLQSCKSSVSLKNEDEQKVSEQQDKPILIRALDVKETMPGDDEPNTLALLHQEIEVEHLELIQNLLSRAYDFDRAVEFDFDFAHLRSAGIKDYLELVKLLLEKGVDPNLSGENGVSLLHWAAYCGHLNIVNLLLEKRANVNITDQGGYSPLQLAAEKGQVATASLLLENGANPNIFSEINCSPLHWAVYHGQVELVNLLLEKGAEIHVVEGDDSPPLKLAVEHGHVEIVRVLLENGADPNTVITNGYTALHWAAVEGYVEISNLLLEKGAELNAIDEDDFTPVDLAIERGHVEVVRLFLDKGLKVEDPEYGFSLLYYAISDAQLEIVNLLLERGANPNIALENNYTFLHWAAYDGNLEIANLLLENGADPTLVDDQNSTPLHIAAYRGHMPILLRLLLCNIDINAQDEDGDTFLHNLLSDDDLNPKELLYRFLEAIKGVEKKQEIFLNNIAKVIQNYYPELTNEDGKSILAMVIDSSQGLDLTLKNQNTESIIAIVKRLLENNQAHEEEVVKTLARHQNLGGWVRSSIRHKRKADTNAQGAPTSKKHRVGL